MQFLCATGVASIVLSTLSPHEPYQRLVRLVEVALKDVRPADRPSYRFLSLVMTT